MSITFERLLPPPYIRPPQIPAGVFSFAYLYIARLSSGVVLKAKSRGKNPGFSACVIDYGLFLELWHFLADQFIGHMQGGECSRIGPVTLESVATQSALAEVVIVHICDFEFAAA